MSKLSSIYMHFPYCKHLCNYCDFYKKETKTSDRNPSKDQLNSFHNYINASQLNHEKLLNSQNIQVGPVETFFLGGGTPSLWSDDGVDFLNTFFENNSLQKLKQKNEYTLEVNPSSNIKNNILRWIEDFGINRISLGVQSLNPFFLKKLDRFHNVEDVYETLELFHKISLNFSVDFMLGLPSSKSQERNIIDELDNVLKYNPSHISLYILTVKSNYRHYDDLPDDEYIEREYLLVSEYLKSKGFLHYEVSNFAKPGFESKHNLKYWANDTVLALGPSATGFIRKNKKEGIRYKWNTKDPSFTIEELNYKQLALEDLYLGLRTHNGFELSKLKNRINDQKIEGVLEKYQKLKYIVPTKNKRITLTSKGFLMLDSIVGDFFHYIKDQEISDTYIDRCL